MRGKHSEASHRRRTEADYLRAEIERLNRDLKVAREQRDEARGRAAYAEGLREENAVLRQQVAAGTSMEVAALQETLEKTRLELAEMVVADERQHMLWERASDYMLGKLEVDGEDSAIEAFVKVLDERFFDERALVRNPDHGKGAPPSVLKLIEARRRHQERMRNNINAIR